MEEFLKKSGEKVNPFRDHIVLSKARELGCEDLVLGIFSPQCEPQRAEEKLFLRCLLHSCREAMVVTTVHKLKDTVLASAL